MSERTGDPHLITAADLANATLPDPPKEVIGNGQIAIVAAQYGRGKTPLLTHMALEAACSVELTFAQRILFGREVPRTHDPDSALNSSHDSFTWQEARLALGIGESTMHRFMKAVTQAGLVVQGPDKVYQKVEGRK